MSLAEAIAVLDRWAHCRCVHSRAPTDPCECRLENGRWVCDNPVRDDGEELTPREKAERRKAKRKAK